MEERGRGRVRQKTERLEKILSQFGFWLKCRPSQHFSFYINLEMNKIIRERNESVQALLCIYLTPKIA